MTTLIGRAGPRRSAPFFLLSAVSGGLELLFGRLAENWRITRTRRLLLSLDERTLRDLGLSRSELERPDRGSPGMTSF